MKRKGVNGVLLTPSSEGWCLWRKGAGGWERAGSAPGLVALLEKVPEEVEWTVALPEAVVVTERMELPAVEPGELAGMVGLQLEKSLPYPVEESAFSFEEVRRLEEGGSVVFCRVAGVAQLERMFEPVRLAGRVPARLFLYGQMMASPGRQRSRELCLWPEPGGVCAAVAYHGRLEFLQGGMESAGDFEGELKRFLLAAELAGAGGALDGVRIDPELRGVEPIVSGLTGLPVDWVETGRWELEKVSGDLVPARWRQEQEKSRKSGDLKARLQLAAAVYLLLVAGAFLFLAWIKYGVRRMDAQLLQIQPVVEEVNQRKALWNALSPAVDPSSYTIELLYLVFRSLPNPDVKITVFEQKAGGFKVEGEAPSPIQWTEFMEKLRAEPGLANYRIEGPPPGVLSNGGARFNIFAKP
jgi:hypothetical protein